MGDEPRAAQASFIAAARRAAQTTAPSDAPELGAVSERMSASVENALSEARSRARAAAASFDRQKNKDGGTGGLFKGKTRPILLSLAGLVLLLGALQIARSVTDVSPTENEQVEALPKLSGAAPNAVDRQAQVVAPAPADVAAIATPEPEKREAATVAAPTATTALGSPGVDGMAVSAIPVQQPSVASLTSLANAGNVAAQFELASRLADGREAKRDPALAATWFRKAADKNHAPSQYRLGALYEKGLGVTKSATEAAQWYRKAASNGNVRAMHNLAVLIADGIDGKPDYGQAAAWFRNAAEHGVRDSQYNLAILFARGLGVEQDMTKSYLWFALAATQGDVDAAKKRDEIAARLDSRKLAEAKVAADTFEIRKPSAAANDTASIEQLLNAPRADVAPVSRHVPGPSSSSKTTARVSAL
jgi:localization factor PodJL